MRKIITVCVAILLVLTASYTALAEEFDQDRIGSVSVTLTETKQNLPIVGAELCVYYVATVESHDNGDLIYEPTPAFQALNTPLNDAALVTKLEAFVAQNNLPCVKMTTDVLGTAVCGDLELGLYFIRQTGAVEGFAPCTPFVVTVPTVTEGEYLYEVNASPKTEVEKLMEVTVKKVWNTNASAKAAESVTVQLLKNGSVIKTATLSDKNNWQVTYTDLPQSDAYTIKEINVPKGFVATYSQNGAAFTVTNTATLPQTGQRTWPIPVLGAVGVILLTVGFALLQKKRKTNA